MGDDKFAYDCDIQKSKPPKIKTKPNEYDYTIMYGIFITLVNAFFIYKYSNLNNRILIALIFIFLVIAMGLSIIVAILYYDIKNTRGQKGQKTVGKNTKLKMNKGKIRVTGNSTNQQNRNVDSIKKKLISKMILYGYLTMLSIFNVMNFAYKLNFSIKEGS